MPREVEAGANLRGRCGKLRRCVLAPVMLRPPQVVGALLSLPALETTLFQLQAANEVSSSLTALDVVLLSDQIPDVVLPLDQALDVVLLFNHACRPSDPILLRPLGIGVVYRWPLVTNMALRYPPVMEAILNPVVVSDTVRQRPWGTEAAIPVLLAMGTARPWLGTLDTVPLWPPAMAISHLLALVVRHPSPSGQARASTQEKQDW